jgi:hypothetical protein
MTDASLRLLALADARLLGEFDRAQADLLRARIAFSMNRGGDTPRCCSRRPSGCHRSMCGWP